MALETWNGSVWVTVATGINPMCRATGAMRAAIRTASPRPASRRGLMRFAASGLGHQGVVDGEEVQQAALGSGRQAGPVPAAEHRPGRGIGGQRASPRLRMPAVAVERNAELQLVSHCRSLAKPMGNTGPRDGRGSARRV